MQQEVMRKLRAVAITAYAKMLLRCKDKRPGKWDPDAYTMDGDRSWLMSHDRELFAKLREETNELISSVVDQEGLDKVLREAGDVSAVAMMIADKQGAFVDTFQFPKIVCLCGSTKFKDEFLEANYRETMQGHIVLSVGSFMHADGRVHSEKAKLGLDDLHKRKIDLADEVLVINVNGYIGSSTKSEIEYTLAQGKPVRYLVDVSVPPFGL